MHISRMSTTLVLSALLMGAAGGTALARESSVALSAGTQARISQKFSDMAGFQWGLSHVTKMQAKGIFKGRAEGIFAPGARITHQEAAVATVRLMGREAEAQALTSAEVDALLQDMPDQGQIAAWARPSVALLVKAGALDGQKPFEPAADATRLDVAILLVKALGYEAEAQAKMGAQLAFKDADLIPAGAKGYVAAAVDHLLVTGYDDMTFCPFQAVKRVEMAVMMGRADGQMDRKRQDEVRGTIRSVDAASGTLVILSREEKEVAVTLSGEASVFVNGSERTLADLKADMKVEAKLDASGKALFVEAKAAENARETALTGTVSALTGATANSLALVTVNGSPYPVSPLASIKVNGEAASWTDLSVGDKLLARTFMGVVVKLEATR